MDLEERSKSLGSVRLFLEECMLTKFDLKKYSKIMKFFVI